MKFSINTNLFQTAITNVSKMAATNAVSQALTGVFISAKDNELVLTCNDLNVALTCKIPAQVEASGEAILSSTLLSNAVRKFSADETKFMLEKNIVNISSGRAKFDMPIIEEEFPQVPAVEKEFEFELEKEVFAKLIRGTAFSTSISEMRPMLTGCFLEFFGDSVRMVALDGYRMAIRTQKVASGSGLEGKSITIPSKSLNDFLKFVPDSVEKIKSVASKRNLEITVVDGENNIEYKFVTRVLNGDFVDYKKTIPSNFSTNVTLETSELRKSVERAATVILSDAMRAPMKIEITSEGLHILCETPAGKGEDYINEAVEGDALNIAFNHKFILDAVRAADSDKVVLNFGKELQPCTITPVDSEEFMYILLPIRS